MRIAVGQIWQETNTLNPCPTTREDFELFGVSRGAEMVSEMAHTNELGGFIQSLRQWADAPEIVGLARLPAWPGGLITADAYEWIADEMATAVDRAMPVDGVLLALHGAMAADGYPDVEGSILHRFRQRIGDHVPLVVTLDLHANITPQMADAADAMVLYHCMPHVDIQDTGIRATGVLERITNSGARPVTAYQRVPVVLPAERANTEADNGFAVRRKQRLQELERMPHVMSAGVSVVQPWMDIPDLSSTVVVVTDNDETLAVDLCSELSSELWDTRREYLGELESIEVAVQKAAECTAGLTVLGDAADATTSGAPGDSVWILQELLKYDWPNLAVVTIVAPEVVEQASLQGIGNQLH
ncbi:MAG: M81 family metallopeptidase, partial [Pirellulales bacterium]|nr:M81 family metallopeptidase [Pirellulales bacterium]